MCTHTFAHTIHWHIFTHTIIPVYIWTHAHMCIHIYVCTCMKTYELVNMDTQPWNTYAFCIHLPTYLCPCKIACFPSSEARFWVSHTCIDCSAHCCVYYHNCFHVVCGEPCRQEEGKNWGNCGGEKEWGEGDVKFLFSGLYTTTLCDQNSWKVLFEDPRGRIP